MNRFCFVQDDSCHWYCIPADQRHNFDLWVESFVADASTYRGPDFEQYRLNMHISNYSFTDPKETL
jgi:hypothetical protein